MTTESDRRAEASLFGDPLNRKVGLLEKPLRQPNALGEQPAKRGCPEL
jgi:hypothetical protein